MACSSLAIHACTSTGVIAAVRWGVAPADLAGVGWKYKERLCLCSGVKTIQGAEVCDPSVTHSCLQTHTCVSLASSECLATKIYHSHKTCGSAVSVSLQMPVGIGVDVQAVQATMQAMNP